MRLAVFLAVLLAASAVSAQPTRDSTVRPVPQVGTEPAATATIPFVRRPGDRVTIRVVKSRTERDGGVLVDSVSGTWLVDARVLASRPRGYTMAWTYRAELDGADVRGPRFDPTTNTLEGIPVVFRTDADGQPFEIANGDSLRVALDRAIRRLAPRASPERRAALNHVRATAATDAGLESLFLADADRFHLASGTTYPVGRPVTQQASLPNPFGGAPIPAVATVQLERGAARDSVVTVRWRQTPDVAALARIVLDLLAEVSPDGPRLTAAEVARRFGVEEQATYRLGRKRGDVMSLRYEKAVRFGGRTRTERLTMTARPPTPRRPPGDLVPPPR